MVNPLKCAPLWARDHIIAYCPLWAVPLEAHTVFSAWLDYSAKNSYFHIVDHSSRVSY